MSIKFDTVEIQDATHIPQFVQHEDTADRNITSLPIARQDGEVLIVELYGKKIIRLQGTLVGTSQADLESKIDTFKELFSRKEKNLDVDWNGATRRYVASCSKHTFNRDHFNISAVPWTAEFTVLSGEGKDTSTTTALNAHVISPTSSAPATDSFTMSGGKPAKPLITLQGNNFPTSVSHGIEYMNTDTGEKIVYTNSASWGNTDSIIIDCANRRVTANVPGLAYSPTVTFYGTFPSFILGTNNVSVAVGGLINQESGEAGDFSNLSSGSSLTAGTQRVAQSFSVPYANDTFQGVQLVVTKTGSPTGYLIWEIQTDNGGKPSGTLVDVTNSTGTILVSGNTYGTANVSGTPQYFTSYGLAMYTLQANTKYWLVVRESGLDVSNYMTVWVTPPISTLYRQYTRGNIMRSTDSGATYAADLGPTACLCFKVSYGGIPGNGNVKHSVVYTKTYL